jgi:hypothetical protein
MPNPEYLLNRYPLNPSASLECSANLLQRFTNLSSLFLLELQEHICLHLYHPEFFSEASFH